MSQCAWKKASVVTAEPVKCHCGRLAAFVLTSTYERFISQKAENTDTALCNAHEFRCPDHAHPRLSA